MDSENSISFSKSDLATAANNFGSIKTKVITEIENIKANLETIDTNWSGPEHNAASNDKNSAASNLQKAKDIINNLEGALAQLSSNANKVSYNGGENNG